MIHRFAVDKMLGRLATWLRIVGQDATYGPHLSGQTLVRHARAQGRTILTRNLRLQHEAPGVPLLFIESDHFRDQFRQVITAFQIDPCAHTFTRCARCNEPVVPVGKVEIEDHVPPYVFATQTRFVRCPRCSRIYWPATHHAHVVRELAALGFRNVPAA
jgi:uncharacterized protein with PIN domain